MGAYIATLERYRMTTSRSVGRSMLPVVLGIVCAALFVFFVLEAEKNFQDFSRPQHTAYAILPFIYSFNAPGILQEAGSMEESTSPYWWVNSGGQLVIGDGLGKTMQGDAPLLNKWRLLYSLTNPVDTDAGTHPQNIFRLVSRSSWADADIRMTFRITGLNMSDSPNRNASNGVLIFGRYYDGDNTYYAGVRDDGQAIIKKKANGVYYTLAAAQIFGTAGKYDRETKPTLLPVQTWMGLRVSIENAWDGSVLIRMYLDRGNTGTFVSVLSARDRGVGSPPFREAGHVGIRTDFKDVEFQSFSTLNP